jgi:DNA-binding NtrC family response regulator
MVDDLTASSEFALARIWLIDSGDLCEGCFLRDQCADRRACLHLFASAGRSCDSQQPQSWDRLDGAFRRLPLNVQKIGRIGATGKPLVISRVGSDGGSLMHRTWVADEHIRGFFGYPLQRDGEISGVFAVFSRVVLDETLLALLQTIAASATELVAQASRQSQLQLEIRLRTLETHESSASPAVTVRSAAARKLEAQLQLAAKYDNPVLITGKPGTDPREIARRIHDASPQKDGLFLPVEAGRFAGQLLQPDPHLASRLPAGTLLLENIDRVAPEQQQALATALDGLRPPLRPEGRRTKILASIGTGPLSGTSPGLQHKLHCLLSVLTVEIPPLCERLDDLPEFSNHILNRLQRRHNRTGVTLAADELAHLQQYSWPGNDRELELMLEQALLRLPAEETVLRNVLGTTQSGTAGKPDGPIASEEQVRQWQRENLTACLKQCHWKVYGKDGAAALMGIRPTTLVSRMKKLGIVKPHAGE